MSLQRSIEEKLGVPGTADPEVEIKLYVGTDKDSNWSKLSDARLSEKAQRDFVYTGYEVELTCLINVTTGKATCTHVNGVALEEAISV